MMNPRPLRIAHVMIMRLSHDLDSSTVLPLLEKFISKSATEAVTTAAMVEMRRIWLYTSFMISLAFSYTVGAANACVLNAKIIVKQRNPV